MFDKWHGYGLPLRFSHKNKTTPKDKLHCETEFFRSWYSPRHNYDSFQLTFQEMDICLVLIKGLDKWCFQQDDAICCIANKIMQLQLILQRMSPQHVNVHFVTQHWNIWFLWLFVNKKRKRSQQTLSSFVSNKLISYFMKKIFLKKNKQNDAAIIFQISIYI